jgi:hypothetical protein
MILYTLGSTFPPSTRTAGYIVFFAGLLAFLFAPIIGLLFMLGGVFVAFAKNKIELDPKKKQYRLFTSIVGIKMGKWLSLEDFPYITILKKREVTTTYSRASNTPATTGDDTFYGIYLLNKSHRKKLLITRLSTREEATAHLDRLSVELVLTVTKYAPALSAASQKRARGRR